MTPGVRPLVAGNWKMNGLAGSLAEIDALRKAVDAGESGQADLLVCPPATLIAQAALRIGSSDLSLGAQDCYIHVSGAFTGDISPAQLTSLSGIPSAGPIITRRMRRSAPRRKRR
jgi:triosephosphate isomerase